MTDAELIAAAARAAGINWRRYDLAKLQAKGYEISSDMLWNPLENSGQALELMVQLSIDVDFDPHGAVRAVGMHMQTFMACGAVESPEPDQITATRRVITLVAAQLALQHTAPTGA